MAKYRVETNKGTFEVESDREPTQADVEAYLAAQEAPQAPSAENPNRGAGGNWATPPREQPQLTFNPLTLAGRSPAVDPRQPQPSSPEELDRRLRETFGGVAQAGPKLADMGASMGIRGGMPAVGQAIGALPPVAAFTAGWSVPVLGGIFGVGGAFLDELRKGKLPTKGDILSSFAANTVPGAPLATATTKAVVKEGLRQGGANLAGSAIQKAVDEGGLITAREAFLSGGLGFAAPAAAKGLDKGIKVAAKAEEKLRSIIADENLMAGFKAGYKATPAAMAKALKTPSAGAANTALETVGGLAESSAVAILHNQRKTNELAAKALGLNPLTPLRRDKPDVQGAPGVVLDDLRETLGAPYKQIETIAEKAKADLNILDTKNRLTAQNDHELAILMSDPKVVKERAELATKAAADVKALKTARFEARTKFRMASESGGDPKLIEDGIELMKKAEKIEDAIEETAKLVGDEALLAKLRDARMKIAKTHAVEAALGKDGNISAPVLGRLFDNDVPLTDELRTIARFEQTMGGNMRESMKSASPTGGHLKAALSLAGASAGMGPGMFMRDPGTAVAGAMMGGLLPFAAPKAAKSLLLSDAWQNRMMRPEAIIGGPAQADMAANVARFATADAARRPNSYLEFLKKEFPRTPQAPLAPNTQLGR
jgi:hypothetical protein